MRCGPLLGPEVPVIAPLPVHSAIIPSLVQLWSPLWFMPSSSHLSVSTALISIVSPLPLVVSGHNPIVRLISFTFVSVVSRIIVLSVLFIQVGSPNSLPVGEVLLVIPLVPDSVNFRCHGSVTRVSILALWLELVRSRSPIHRMGSPGTTLHCPLRGTGQAHLPAMRFSGPARTWVRPPSGGLAGASTAVTAGFGTQRPPPVKEGLTGWDTLAGCFPNSPN